MKGGLEMVRGMVRMALNQAAINGISDDPRFLAELEKTSQAVRYAAGVNVFEDATYVFCLFVCLLACLYH